MFKHFKSDLFGGVTAAIIALPLALAFGVASGLGASAGLLGAIIVGFFAALLGGTPSQVSGPTGPMTVVVASLVALYSNDLNIVFWAIFLAGIFQIAAGYLKFGNLIKYVPYPVISGFMSGIGIIIILLQINPLLGEKSLGSTLDVITSFVNTLNNISLNDTIIGVLALLTVFLTPKSINKKFPAPLIALVVCTVLAYFFIPEVKTIGEIQGIVPHIKIGLINLSELVKIIPMAGTLCILGCVDSLLTSLVADSVTGYKHDSKKELIGQGIGNSIAGIFGGLAGAGATMRTVINIKAGGTTRLSGIIHSLFLVLIAFALSPLVAKIPLAVLAGILVKVGFDIIDYKLLKLAFVAPKRDLIVAITVLLITVLNDLIFAVGVGIVLSAILFAVSVADKTKVSVKPLDNNDFDIIPDKLKQKIILVELEGALFFGTTPKIIETIENLLDTRIIILNCSSSPDFDISAVFAIRDLASRLHEQGAAVYLVLSNKKNINKFNNLIPEDLISKKEIFTSISKAVEQATLKLSESENS